MIARRIAEVSAVFIILFQASSSDSDVLGLNRKDLVLISAAPLVSKCSFALRM